MSTAMYDAREALIPGSAYDRSGAGESRVGPAHFRCSVRGGGRGASWLLLHYWHWSTSVTANVSCLSVSLCLSLFLHPVSLSPSRTTG